MDLQCWPLFGLTITTPRLELRYVDDEIAAGLMTLAATDGVHDPGFMPFVIPWTRFEPPYLQRQGMQHYWRTRADTSPQKWALPMAAFDAGELVGVQSVAADGFPVTRWCSTGSWLGRSHQGRGIGKEMRSAVLHLAFDVLGAEYAETSAFTDNPRSLGVTRSIGYEHNGWRVVAREGEPARHEWFVLTREAWLEGRRDDIEVRGFDDGCREVLGL